MAERHQRESPAQRLLAELAAASEAPAIIRLAELPFLTQLTVRVEPEASGARAIAGALGVDLPGTGGVQRAGHVDVLGLGPDEWLLVGPCERGQLEEQLKSVASHGDTTIVDVSAQRTVLEVAGSAARDTLQKGCSLDLHPRAFAIGRCAQVSYARTSVILHHVSGEPVYRVAARASFAEYVAEWLLDASAEYRRVS